MNEDCSRNESCTRTKYEYDSETGNYYAFARYYSWRLGRFMTPDPAPGSQDSCQSLNLYAYTSNIPTSFSDPSGLDPCPLVVAGTGDNPTNSKAILEFAQKIGANVVFPLPGSVSGFVEDAADWYSAVGVSDTAAAIQASSGPIGGPTSVITFSAGAGYYNQAEQYSLNSAQNTAPNNVAYVMPYMPMDTTTGPVTGTQSTTLFNGTGPFNALLQGLLSLDFSFKNVVNLSAGHDQNQIFPTLLTHLPFYPGPKCKHPKIFIGGGTIDATLTVPEIVNCYNLEDGGWTCKTVSVPVTIY
jgi:RHS repeat-associated protein